MTASILITIGVAFALIAMGCFAMAHICYRLDKIEQQVRDLYRFHNLRFED